MTISSVLRNFCILESMASGMETINGNYFKSLYGIDKMSDLKDFTFAELGDIHKTAEDVMLRFPKDWNSHPRSLIESVCMTLSCLKDIQKK